MKTFKQIISEVAEPLGDDEKRFKAKHVIQKIDHPVADENQFTAKNTKKDKSKISGYKDGEDAVVYEEKTMTCEDCGEEYDSDGECDCEDDEEDDDDLDEATLTDTEKKKREHIVTGMKKSEADLKARYGDKWKSLMYATATKHALHSEAKKAKPGHNAAVMAKNIGKVLSAVKKEEVELDEKAKWRSSSAAIKITDPNKDLGLADYDYHYDNPRSTGRLKSIADTEPSDGSINNRQKSNINSIGKRKGMISKADIKRVKSNAYNALKKEEVDLDEAFKAGSMKLNDGSSVTLTNESSNALNTLFNQLTSTNKTKMEQRLMSGSKGFNEILAFAKEV
jgi:hypothetical protein